MLQKIITKIEGEAKLKIYGKKIIDFAQIEFWQYRGIEKYLENRHYLDACVINPRICGICGHSHLLATTLAFEDAFGFIPTKKANILREITTGLEIVQNHIKWFYMTLFPTQINEKNFLFKSLKITRKIAKAIALLAGQFPHNSYILPGGVTCDPTFLEIVKLKDLLNEIYDEIQSDIIDENGNSKDLEIFFENLPKDIGKSVNRFLVLGENLYFKPNGRAECIKEKENSSFSKNVFYKDTFYEVGPLSRNLNNYLVKQKYDEFKDSIYTRIFARLFEIILILKYLFKEIEKLDLNEKSFVKPNLKDGLGLGIIEAPRGSLIHEVEIKNEIIRKYNIIVPTQFNLSSHTKDNPSPAQKALMDEDIKYLDTIFKCFDICAVCVSH